MTVAETFYPNAPPQKNREVHIANLKPENWLSYANMASTPNPLRISHFVKLSARPSSKDPVKIFYSVYSSQSVFMNEILKCT